MFLRLLNERNVDYLVVGGYAVGYFGYPRATGDLDIWVRSTEANALRLVEALPDFGFSVPELQAELFMKPNQIIRLGVPPNRIELLTSISGVEFEEAFEAREEVVIAGLPIYMISLDHLKQNKRAAGRPRDIDDLGQLP